MLAVRCPCGLEVTGEENLALVAAVEAHLADRHPRLVGAYDADDVLALAYRRPPSTSIAEGAS